MSTRKLSAAAASAASASAAAAGAVAGTVGEQGPWATLSRFCEGAMDDSQLDYLIIRGLPRCALLFRQHADGQFLSIRSLG
jgi:hypothetical protein